MYIYNAIRINDMTGVVCDLGVAARAIHKGKILLVKEARGNYQNLWGLPKGSVDEGESPESAVLRELTEETGVSGTIVGLSAVRSTLYKQKPAVFLCYDVTIDSDQTSLSTDEICLLYTSPSPRDAHESRMPSSA